MENKANRFWMYLLEKGAGTKALAKEEIIQRYSEFVALWKDRKNDFERVFDSLRKTRIKYMFHKKWYILSKEEFEDLKNNRLEEMELMFRFLDNQQIPYYIGLSSAKYLNKLTWQSLKFIYIINAEFKLNRKIGNVEIKMVKFPRPLIVNITLIKTQKGIPYSDIEKTLLDEIYYNEYKKGKLQIMDYNFEELNLEKMKAYLAFYSRYKLVKKELMNKLNKEQVKQL